MDLTIQLYHKGHKHRWLKINLEKERLNQRKEKVAEIHHITELDLIIWLTK
jgi:hypothetical protein